VINAVALSQTRTERGLSQRKLAKLVGLNFQVIRRLEMGGDDGNLTLRDFDQLCRSLDVPPTALLQDPSTRTGDTDPRTDAVELDLGQARLLRRIQLGEDVRRSLSTDEQQLVLPTLCRLGLVRTERGGRLTMTPQGAADLLDPEAFVLPSARLLPGQLMALPGKPSSMTNHTNPPLT